MQKYLNNWAYELDDVLPASETTLPLAPGALNRISLAQGESLSLTIAASFDPLSTTSAEVITLTGQAGGSWTVARGTNKQTWPRGSVIYAALPAEHLNAWVAQFASILARLDALDGGGSTPANALTDSSGQTLTDANGELLTIGA